MNWLLFILLLVATGAGVFVANRIFGAYERSLEAREAELQLKLERQREMTLKAEGRWAAYYAKMAGTQQEKPADPEGDDRGTNWDPKVIGALHGLGVNPDELEAALEQGNLPVIQQAIAKAAQGLGTGANTESAGLVG